MLSGRLRLFRNPVVGTLPVPAWSLFLLLVWGCSDRDRLTFPDNDGLGPEVTITAPTQDTTVSAGPFFFVDGRVTDRDGIDTVYFEVSGGAASFPPFIADGVDTVRFSLPLVTNGLGGSTINVSIFGVDLGGVRGDTALRLVTVQ
jgi:Bacterial Ig domain